jgi:translation initiation factor IF-2
MAGMTVQQLAQLLNLPVERLLVQFKDAGLKPATAASEVNPAEKIKLLEFLRTAHGKANTSSDVSAPAQITLKRKTVNELPVSVVGGSKTLHSNKTVSVEVRQKRTYVQRAAVAEPSNEHDLERADAIRKLGESKLRAESEEMIRRDQDARRNLEEAKKLVEDNRRRGIHVDEPLQPAVVVAPAVEVSPITPIKDAATDVPIASAEKSADATPARVDAPARSSFPPRTGAPAGGYPPRTGAPAGGYPPRTGAPAGGYPPRTGAPAGGYPPRTGAPAGGYPPRTGAPAGGYPPRTGAPAGGYPPRTGAPAGGYPPRTGAPAGGYPPRTGAPAGGYPPRTGAPAGAAVPGAPRNLGPNSAPLNERKNNYGKNAPKGKATGAVPARGRDGDNSTPSYDLGQLHLADGATRRPKRRAKGPRDLMRGAQNVATGPHAFSKPTAPVTRDVAVGDSIQVGELASLMAVKTGEVIKSLMKMGVMATINQIIDHDTAALVAEELGHVVTRAADTDVETTLIAAQSDEVTEPRPPVVTIMGHVDHGKTSLLDYIRRTKVASGEAGGITQHIGAYHVTTPKGVITFLDTPGHAAFTSMRARGAKLTDIIVLVVAADDGVMPQTIEAIKHAKAAGVPLIVAVNKMDKADADPERVKQGLLQHEVVPEEFGGDVQFIPLSAKTGMGVDALLENISVQAEVMELRAATLGRARGTVVESSLDKGRGTVATILVQSGTLKKGDVMLCGTQWGRVRAMFDETGRQITEAGPSIPAVVIGLQGTPNAGDDFMVLANERMARDAALERENKIRDQRLTRSSAGKLEDMFSQMTAADVKTLNILVKADVQGSVEALRESLVKLATADIKVNVISSGVGGITESDASLAVSAKALVIGFNVRADASARKVLSDGGVSLNYYSIIYEAIDHVRGALTGLLGNEIKEVILGTAQVRDVFRSTKFGAVAGCMVLEGVVKRSKPIRVLRDNVVIFQGELESLRRFKDLVDDVRNGMECGIAVKQYNDVKVNDQIECFDRIEVARTL